jgi:hypothetical protein
VDNSTENLRDRALRAEALTEAELKRLLRAVGIRNIKDCHTRILQQRPRVSPRVVVGWLLAAHHDQRIQYPERYVSTVLEDAPWKRDAVPGPFDAFAALPSETWALFAEHTWLERYLFAGGRAPIPADLQDVYERWRRVYGEYRTCDLPLGLGEVAAQRIHVWRTLAGEGGRCQSD